MADAGCIGRMVLVWVFTGQCCIMLYSWGERERERETIIITTFIDSNLEFLQESIRSLSSVSMCHLLPPNWIMAMDHIHHFAQSQVHRAQVRLFQDNVVASLTMVEFDTPLVLGAGVGDGR